jgi:site-specific recombinase XerD
MQFEEATTAFLDGYFATCKRSAKTQTAYRTDLAQLRDHLGAARSLGEVTPEHLEAWAVTMRSDGYKGVSVRRKFATARVFFGHWVRRKVLDNSPLWHLRLDLGRERVLPRSLSPGDAKRLIEAAWHQVIPCKERPSPRDDAFRRLRNLAGLEVLFATGMRVGELVSIDLADWHDDEAFFKIKGKGSRERLAFLPDQRSLKAVRTYLTFRRALSLGHDAFLINGSGSRITTQGIAHSIAAIAKAGGVTTRVTPHMVRHTVATLLLRYGADIRVVQEVLGHASIATTQRYTHVAKEHLLDTLRTRHPSHHLSISLQQCA